MQRMAVAKREVTAIWKPVVLSLVAESCSPIVLNLFFVILGWFFITIGLLQLPINNFEAILPFSLKNFLFGGF